jgi:hypothetical protein
MGGLFEGTAPLATRGLGSPYGERILAPPQIDFIDLRQIGDNWYQMLTKIIKFERIHVEISRDVFFSEKIRPAGTLHNIAKGLVPQFAEQDRFNKENCLSCHVWKG